jgi:hypothetical protein
LDLKGAESQFKKKFKDKTGQAWESVAGGSFAKIKGKYGLVETEDAEGGADESPLGKLSEAQIRKGQAVLDLLEKELAKKKNSTVAEKIAKLSSDFYSLVPTNTGWKKPPPLDTPEKLQEKQELLKFYLRMGFDDLSAKEKKSPISGVLSLKLPGDLTAASLASPPICNKFEVQNCDNRAKNFLAKNKVDKALTTPLVGAVYLYTGNAIYSDLNKSLREENAAKLKKYLPYLRLFLETFGVMEGKKKKLTVWRGVGVNLLKDYTVGKRVTWWGVSSTTTAQQVARSFAGSCGPDSTIFTIECQSAIDISAMSFFPHEKECLLPPGTQFDVVSAKKGKGSAEITLREVGRLMS